MDIYDMHDQAVQIKRQWLTGWLARQTTGLHWRSTGRGMVAGCQPGQGQAGAPKGGGLMRMLGGQRRAGCGPSAQHPEGGCLPCRGGSQLAWRHWEDGW